MKNRKQFGWAIRMKKNSPYYREEEATYYTGCIGDFNNDKEWSYPYAGSLKDASVFTNRENARCCKDSNETVVKVSLDLNNKPVAVIGKG